jgi:hypothetical protein
MSKGQPYLTALSYPTLKGQPNDFSLFLPVLGGGNRGHLNVSSPPPIYARGGGVRWLAGSFFVLRPCQRAGRDEGQETTLTQDNLSYVLSSTFTKLYIPNCNNLPNNDDGQSIYSLVPFPLNRKLNLIVSPLS